MKLYLTLALIALLLNTGYAKNVPKNRNLKGAASEEVVVQETAADSDDLTENVVDNDNTVVHNAESLTNTVNLLDNTAPEVTLVENAPTKTLNRVSTVNVAQPLTTRTVVTPVQVPSVQTLNVVKTQAPLQTVNVVKTASVPTSKTVVVNQAAQVPQQLVTVQQQPQAQQWVLSQPQTQQVLWQQQPQQVKYVQVQQPQAQQWVLNQPQTQQVLWQQPQQQVVTVQQPQSQQWLVNQAPQQQQLVVLRKQAPVRKQVLVSQPQSVQVVKTVQRVPNPLVVSLTPSKTVSRQTVLTGSQLVSDVTDESSKSDVVVQETESNY